MKGRAKKADTFLVKIMDHEHATWQGKVTWIEGQREQYFRSALELIKLIDDAVEKEQEMEGVKCTPCQGQIKKKGFVLSSQ